MIKLPQPGRVKTRLAADIGAIQATWWFRHQTRALIRRLDHDPRWDLVLAVAPDCAGLTTRIWPAHIPRIAQGGGNLGDRMARVFASFRDGPVMIIGADIPGIDAARVAEGFRALGRADAVIGPAPDGGYWTIGLRQGAKPPPKMLFRNVRWSTAHAREDTIASMGDHRVAMISALRDVDRAADLKKL
ncbi:MAG: TIGR04282 family arsenosugar biosynthesis glycosyltransferase [Pseudomonadota bacterium]